MYDTTQRTTFTSVMSWLKDFREFTDDKLSVILIGTLQLLRKQEGLV